jgi:hypothetical protein
MNGQLREAAMFPRLHRCGVFVLVLALSSPLGACFEVLANPPNFHPTAYEDSVCKHVPSSSQVIVNYGCVAGTELALGD